MSTASTTFAPPEIDNIVELPYCDKERVVGFLQTRFFNNKLYTWAGNVLLSIQPFKDTLYKDDQQDSCLSDYAESSVEALVERVWFRLNNRIGKGNQAILASGDSGSGKTFSICLAIRAITYLQPNGSEGDHILRQAWAAVPLLNAFGNAPTLLNTNSSRFGKLLRLQYTNGKLAGALVETYLIEKTRVVSVNAGEGNFHIFRQILDSLDEGQLNSLHLSKLIDYRIAPDILVKSTYGETIKAMDTLNICEQNDILTILAAILNLGNITFQQNIDPCHGDGCEFDNVVISTLGQKYLKNVSYLLQVGDSELAELLCTIQFAAKRRMSVFKSQCRNVQDCETRRDCLMKYLYVHLFKWLVNAINNQIYQGATKEQINLVDLFGLEVFDHNTFEQLCINYTNERMMHYFTRCYLQEQGQILLEEGYQVDCFDCTEATERINLLDGSISIFGILNEECAMNRFKSNLYINTRLGHTFRNSKHFFLNDELDSTFCIRHYAGVVKYETETMIAKNRDKVPVDIVKFLKRSNYNFIQQLLENDENLIGSRRRTILCHFKVSVDNLIETLDQCDVHYIKCLKPNNYKIAGFFDQDYFAQQLRYNGVFEILKLSFQNYSITMDLHDFTQRMSYPLHLILKNFLGHDMHVGRTCIFLTETCFLLLERFDLIRRNIAARILQRSWIKLMRQKHRAATIIQRRFRRHCFDNRQAVLFMLNDTSKTTIYTTFSSVDMFKSSSTIQKVEHFLNTNLVEVNNEGTVLSLQLEKCFNETLTKKFKRVLFFGDRIVSYSRLAEVPVRLNFRGTFSRNSHLLPKLEVSRGVTDIF